MMSWCLALLSLGRLLGSFDVADCPQAGLTLADRLTEEQGDKSLRSL